MIYQNQEYLAGTVTQEPHRSSPYVQVSVPQDDGAPLSLKARVGKCDRQLLQKNTIAVVERTSGGYKGWVLLALFSYTSCNLRDLWQSTAYKRMPDRQHALWEFFNTKRRMEVAAPMPMIPMDSAINNILALKTLPSDRQPSEGVTTMKKITIEEGRRVRFQISETRCDNFPYRQLLEDCFGIPRLSKLRYERLECPDGVFRPSIVIICRPDQFAQFIIQRDQMELQNWVHELSAEYVSQGHQEFDPYAAVAARTGYTSDTVRKVLDAVGARPPAKRSSTHVHEVWEFFPKKASTYSGGLHTNCRCVMVPASTDEDPIL